MTGETTLMTSRRPQAAMPADESPGAVRMRRLRAARRSKSLCRDCDEEVPEGSKQCVTHKLIDRDRKRRTARLKQQPY